MQLLVDIADGSFSKALRMAAAFGFLTRTKEVQWRFFNLTSREPSSHLKSMISITAIISTT
jgi:hypothetical protein